MLRTRGLTQGLATANSGRLPDAAPGLARCPIKKVPDQTMATNVVIVESPAKAKTINKYLGSEYQVIASYGHVRDLPAKDGSVRPDEDFAMSWEVDGKSSKRLSEIAAAVRDADKLILATDPDREGEAISWHVLQVLNGKRVIKDKPVERVVFNAITKQAVLEAMANPRAIDVPLVDAYLARRALDYLVGFTLSPVLWRKLPGARSAGRVQSVALRLICDREAEIEAFKAQEYWSIVATLLNGAGQSFDARIAEFEGRKLQRLDIASEAEATAIKSMLEGAKFTVADVESKPAKRNPFAPFTTSTLQQDASRKLGMSAQRIMQVAQRLYEGIDIGGETAGLITYMRTDGVEIAPEAIGSIRSQIGSEFGPRYLPEKPRYYTAKAKNAQEAHEAIRPTDISRTPKEMARFLDDDQRRLYELIWRRTIASQMASAEIERTVANISAENAGRRASLRANGQVIRFDGFLAAYEVKLEEDEEEGSRLPELKVGENPRREKIEAKQHFTEPPPRFSEASLIKRMEELGIGRPSTYAAIIATLQDREYVKLDKRRFVPESKGRLVTSFLEGFFRTYVEYDFTADLEEKLDRISAGELTWREVLREFWKQFSGSVEEIRDLRVTEVLDRLNTELAHLAFPAREDGSDPRSCPTCGTGNLSLKIGKYGAFVGCSNYPECKFTRQLGAEGADGEAASDGPKALGVDPATGEEVTLRSGRFGPYVQRGDGKEAGRSSLPKGTKPDAVDLAMALELLSLPREVTRHPTTGEPILAGIGRFGPYVQHGRTYANLGKDDDVLTIGQNRAIDLIVAKENGGGGRRGGSANAAGKVLGDHPSGGPVSLLDGRYGPYVKHGKVNATLPKGMAPDSVTLEQAVALVDAKGASGAKASPRGKPAAKGKKAAAKPVPAAKAAAGRKK
jgi:DNA topoisomerase I